MVLDASSGADRREFFRINDTVIIEFQSISAQEAEQLGEILNDPLHSANNQERNQFQTLQNAFNHLADQIGQQNRDIARALRLLDEKISIVNHTVQRQQNKSEGNQLIDANLSGGGIAFMVAEQIDTKNAVELKIQLQSSAANIHSVAKVISCKKTKEDSEKPYFLRLAFIDMSEIDRSILIKHILNRQAEVIRHNVK
jgi:PilZ domain-containing protein